MTSTECWNRCLEKGDYLCRLVERWEDEWMYEDINLYRKAICDTLHIQIAKMITNAIGQPIMLGFTVKCPESFDWITVKVKLLKTKCKIQYTTKAF